jgi:bifunctional non-homologous end joining protein LigD
MILPAPMLLSEGRRASPLGQPDWIYELKFDGYRCIAGVEDGVVRLATRQGTDCTKWFPEVAQGLQSLAGGPHVLDGEVCVLDDLGRSDFNRLQDRARRRCHYPDCDAVTFCAFDLLTRDGRSLIDLPVEERKRQLAELLSPAPPSVLYVGHFEADQGPELFAAAESLHLEGVVAKRLGSVYRPGERSKDWIKVKRAGWQEGRRWKG